MSDSCLVFSDDYDSAAFIKTTMPVARKQHKCYECSGTIEPGARYERVIGVWDRFFNRFATCASCCDLRTVLSCGGPFCYGELWEVIGDQGYDLCAKVLDDLTDGRAALETWMTERDAEMLADAAV